MQRALQKSNDPCLQKARLFDLRRHSQGLFPLYCLSLKTETGVRVKLAAKEIASEAMASTENEALRSLKAVGLPVPQSYGYVLLDNKAILFMEFIEKTDTRKPNAALLMEDLLTLYQKTDQNYGWHLSNFIGHLRQPNHWHKSFGEFWWTERIEPQFQLAYAAGHLSAQVGRDLEKAIAGCVRLWSLNMLRPRLVHGDLWSGNLLAGPGGRLYFIDPCPAYANPEQDLGMLELFGSHLSPAQTEEIAKQVGAGSGFHQRVLFWQIYPLLVHLNIFGSAYLGQFQAALRACLRHL